MLTYLSLYLFASDFEDIRVLQIIGLRDSCICRVDELVKNSIRPECCRHGKNIRENSVSVAILLSCFWRWLCLSNRNFINYLCHYVDSVFLLAMHYTFIFMICSVVILELSGSSFDLTANNKGPPQYKAYYCNSDLLWNCSCNLWVKLQSSLDQDCCVGVLIFQNRTFELINLVLLHI